ncbi:MAG: hypothetical protein HC892_20635 [Saprospiraceae bacterium]|nr:hypothetical protein [Saprospiraceae bacterium]
MSTPKVLVVGRDIALIHQIKCVFGSCCQVTPVSRFTDLTEQDQRTPDAIILLHHPPEEDGFARLQTIKEINSYVPIFFVGYTMSSDEKLIAIRKKALDARNSVELESLHLRLFEEIQGYHSKKKSLMARFKKSLSSIPKEFLGIAATLSPYTSEPFIHQATHDLSVQLLGEFRIVVRGKVVKHPLPNKAKILLSYLMMNRDKRILRDNLIRVIWKDVTADYAKNSLNVTIHTLRKWFQHIDKENNYILSKGDHYEINQSLRIETDLDYFKLACREAKTKEQSGDKMAAMDAYFERMQIIEGIS